MDREEEEQEEEETKYKCRELMFLRNIKMENDNVILQLL